MSMAQQMEYQDGLTEALGMNQYLTFLLAGEEYGVDILRVKEIKRLLAIHYTRLSRGSLRGPSYRSLICETLWHERLDYGQPQWLYSQSSEENPPDHGIVDAVSGVYSLGPIR
jgi:hypothetical protein